MSGSAARRPASPRSTRRVTGPLLLEPGAFLRERFGQPLDGVGNQLVGTLYRPDALARIFAGELSTQLGQQVVVDNRPGGSGIIGTELIEHAKRNPASSSSPRPATARACT